MDREQEAYHTGQPEFPPGTPEYEAYAAKLREELRKFAAGEPPYEFGLEA